MLTSQSRICCGLKGECALALACFYEFPWVFKCEWKAKLHEKGKLHSSNLSVLVWTKLNLALNTEFVIRSKEFAFLRHRTYPLATDLSYKLSYLSTR